MTTETTYTCAGTDECHHVYAATGIPCIVHRSQHRDDSDHRFKGCNARCDAEVWRAFGCDIESNSRFHYCTLLAHRSIHAPMVDNRRYLLAPIMSAPETEAAWLGVRVLLEEVNGWPESGYQRVRFMSSMARSLRLEPNGGASYGALVALTKATPAAIGAAFKEAVEHG